VYPTGRRKWASVHLALPQTVLIDVSNIFSGIVFINVLTYGRSVVSPANIQTAGICENFFLEYLSCETYRRYHLIFLFLLAPLPLFLLLFLFSSSSSSSHLLLHLFLSFYSLSSSSSSTLPPPFPPLLLFFSYFVASAFFPTYPPSPPRIFPPYFLLLPWIRLSLFRPHVSISLFLGQRRISTALAGISLLTPMLSCPAFLLCAIFSLLFS
jgi:hypothetical protein